MTPQRVDPRRRDRGKDEGWIRTYMERAPWGVLALPVPGGPPYLNSNLFVYRGDPDRIYLHTARTGGLSDALAAPEGVEASFTAAAMGRLLPADEALEFSVEYNAVVVTGWCRTVADATESQAALQALLYKYAPHLKPDVDYRGIVPDELRRTAVYRLDVERWSGKEKAVGEHPGAFELAGVPLPFEAATEEGGDSA